ncbi:tetratricopeptide repeat protein [Paenibacillaceae bacterium]|nr:tetratricopeptide repeat protein [Paenibacillaceae bacterium]
MESTKKLFNKKGGFLSMICLKCQQKIISESIFCSFCGEKVVEVIKEGLIEPVKPLPNPTLNIEPPSDVETPKPAPSPFKSYDTSERVDTERIPSGRRSKVKLYILSACSLLIIATVIVFNPAMPYQKYSHAKSLMSSERFDEAALLLIDLGDYKDSSALILENDYLHANYLKNNQQFEQAIALFEQLDTYKESMELRVQSEFLHGKTLLEAGNYAESLEYLLKNRKHEESVQLIREAQYQLGKQHIEQTDYSSAFRVLGKIKTYRDTAQILDKAYYLVAVRKYEEGDFKSAKFHFSKSNGYDDAKKYLDNIDILNTFQGTWGNEDGFQNIIFSGNQMAYVFYPGYTKQSVISYPVSLVNNEMHVSSKVFIVTDNKLINIKDNKEFTKISHFTRIPEEKLPPAIGMTANEARNTKWGVPTKINKTKTKFGETEQWVFSGFRYIYLDDGIVTAIQE